jgi:lysozyme
VKLLRIAVASLSLSAIGATGIFLHEDYTGEAIIPTKNDRPTVGFGSTFREDGSPVRLGDRITPPKAVARAVNHIAKDEVGLKRCVTGPMSQIEYDILVDFTYQYGVAATCSSSMVRHINAGQYRESCVAYALYKRSGGRDCSNPVNWGPMGCKGVWTRNQERRDKCLKSQEGEGE